MCHYSLHQLHIAHAHMASLHADSSVQVNRVKELLHALRHDVFQFTIIFGFSLFLLVQKALKVCKNFGFEELVVLWILPRHALSAHMVSQHVPINA